MAVGSYEMLILKSLALDPEHKTNRQGDTGGSTAAGGRGARSSQEPIALGNQRAPPLGNPAAWYHVVTKGKYEGRYGYKAKVIIKVATTSKGSKGDKRSPVAGQTSNGEGLATKVKTMVNKMALEDTPIQDPKTQRKYDGHGDTGGSIAAVKIRQGSLPVRHNPTWCLVGSGSGNGSHMK